MTLTVVQFRLPPLRERGEDVLLLAGHFLKMFGATTSKNVKAISPLARQKLLSYDWPGNVRELRNVIERALILETSQEIQAENLPDFSVERGLSKTGNSPPRQSPVVPAAADGGSASADRATVALDAERTYWKSLIAKELKKLEDAFPTALDFFSKYQEEKAQANSHETHKKKIRQSAVIREEDFGKALDCSHPTVGKLFRFSVPWSGISHDIRSGLIREVSQEFPNEWKNLRSEQSPFAKFL